MRLGFYYHTVAYQLNTEIYLPGYLGVFIDELAKNCNILHLYLQTSTVQKSDQDYRLVEQNIDFHDLGSESPAWYRDFFHHQYLSKIDHNVFDKFIVRSPSPLAPYFEKTIPTEKLCYLVVGDYFEGRQAMRIKSPRDIFISWYLKRNHKRFMRVISKSKTIVNSPELFRKLNDVAPSISMVKTTTLSEKSFVEKPSNQFSRIVKILYTGRFDWAKGLKELAEAVVLLNNQSKTHQFELHFAGWQLDGKDEIVNWVNDFFSKKGYDGKFFNHGKKSVGDDLNQVYRMSDIYIIPSYHEGFPRTIWEAMAQGLPVIATKVGAIPDYLDNGKNALLIEPKSVEAIVNAVYRLINNEPLKIEITQNAMHLARENTLEIQTKRLIQVLHE
jgi:glycosyltransferase involved in cell wall biosynthesis